MGSEERVEPARPAAESLGVAQRRAPVAPLIAIAVVAALIGIALGWAINWFPVAASTQAHKVDTFYDVLIAASVPMFVLVAAVVLYSVYRFRMRPGEEDMDGPPVHGNTRLEVVWTVIPAVLMLSLCTYAYITLHDAEKAPAATGAQKELQVRVVGEQFTWLFYYPGVTTPSPQLYVPKDRSVRFTVQTKDVIHDFWVPAFRWKIDAVPGINTYYRITPDRLGTYDVVCAELCGLGHATMRSSAHVVTGQQFTAWLGKLRKGGASAAVGGPSSGGQSSAGGQASAGGAASASEGKSLFASNGCSGCHTLKDAGATGTTGPDLDLALKGKAAAFIKQSIVDPNKVIAKGYQPGIMPQTFGKTLQPSQVDSLVKYLQEATK
jgi:cytochrome c oxidase subunit II